MNTRLLLPIVLFAPVLIAQEHKISIKPTSEGTRFTIESTSKVEATTKMLMNGEERSLGGGRGGAGGGGRGGAAPGPISTTEKVVFVDGGAWRKYDVAEAKVTTFGGDGETNEQVVTGELAGQKISLGAEPAVLGDDDKSTPLSARAARGLPSKIDLSGLAPKAALALDGNYEIAGFHQAVGSLVHPVRAAGGGGGRGARGEAGADTGGGEGGQRARGRRAEGGEGGEAQGARGQARGGAGRGMGARDNPALQVLAAEGVTSKVTGKLAKVENNLATINLTGTVSGKGDPAKLGLGGGLAGMFGGGRGGRGGQAGGGEAAAVPQGESEGSVTVEITGTLVVDLTSNSVQSLNITGSLQSKSNTVRSMDRGGESMEIETDTTQKGSFSLKVGCAPAK